MKLTLGLAALALVALPSLAAAQCTHDKQEQAMSCAEGTTYDSATRACVPVAS